MVYRSAEDNKEHQTIGSALKGYTRGNGKYKSKATATLHMVDGSVYSGKILFANVEGLFLWNKDSGYQPGEYRFVSPFIVGESIRMCKLKGKFSNGFVSGFIVGFTTGFVAGLIDALNGTENQPYCAFCPLGTSNSTPPANPVSVGLTYGIGGGLIGGMVGGVIKSKKTIDLNQSRPYSSFLQKIQKQALLKTAPLEMDSLMSKGL